MKPRIRDVPATIRLPGAPGIDAYRSSRSRRAFTARGFTVRGFTVLELVVVIAVVAVLTSILMPALAKVREGGDRLQCASNLRQVGCAMIDYADDY
jgi:prepilin-type N-terminal cleavage/methylation domain-containing protein